VVLLGDERHIDLTPEELEEIVESYDIDEDIINRFEGLKQQFIKHQIELKSMQRYKEEKYECKFKS